MTLFFFFFLLIMTMGLLHDACKFRTSSLLNHRSLSIKNNHALKGGPLLPFPKISVKRVRKAFLDLGKTCFMISLAGKCILELLFIK